MIHQAGPLIRAGHFLSRTGIAPMTRTDNAPNDAPLIECRSVWKVFGDRSRDAIAAIKSKGLGKREVLSEFG
jgi:hypothetical protein